MIKRIICLLVCVAFFYNIFAQSLTLRHHMQEMKQNFEDYKSVQQHKFETYHQQINAEYAEYMRQVWPKYEVQEAIPLPVKPKPPIFIKDSSVEPTNEPISFDYIQSAPALGTSVKPIIPYNREIAPNSQQFHFSFYGTACAVSLNASHSYKLNGINENSIADIWLQLSAEKYNSIISDCLAWREKLHLPDWGYVRFLEKMTTTFFSAHSKNEATLMQMYILAQSGYKVRIARSDNELVLLLPSEDNIYQYPYLSIEGRKYYIMDKETQHRTYSVFDREFPNEQYFSLQMFNKPSLSVQKTALRTLTSQQFPVASATIATNGNLIDFYNDYPLTDLWVMYVKTSLNEDTRKQLYPSLKHAIDGKNSHQAANILLNFVQTAFAYKTDNSQFGYEKPFFADETLYYPYCDCEDRSILYAILVRELLHLDVVLLYYPNHVATAVCFGQDISGNYLQIDDKRYIVCDPTYINAEVGCIMPRFKDIPAKIMKID